MILKKFKNSRIFFFFLVKIPLDWIILRMINDKIKLNRNYRI